MNWYSRKARWKIYLALAGLIIIVLSLGYTNYLASNMADRERQAMDVWVRAQQSIGDMPDDEGYDVTFQMDILSGNKYIPVIVTDEQGNIQMADNFGENTSDEQLKQELKKIRDAGFEPIRIQFKDEVSYIYYKHSLILQRLKFFPIIQVLLITVFIGLGYAGFSNARRAEQNRVWVGMAKETAHQLGTPISAMIAWIEHLKIMSEDRPEQIEVLLELQKDVDRLELVADRFSKIGSAPELQPVNLYEALDHVHRYMEKRASRRVRFEFPDPRQESLEVRINPHLFEWVLENLLRNALDAMEGHGTIRADVLTDSPGLVEINISDTGKGMPASMFKTVFTPGFTTKKRGWGLGLSLSRRIIENYHRGKIFVKRSDQTGGGTTFTIRLPRY